MTIHVGKISGGYISEMDIIDIEIGRYAPADALGALIDYYKTASETLDYLEEYSEELRDAVIHYDDELSGVVGTIKDHLNNNTPVNQLRTDLRKLVKDLDKIREHGAVKPVNHIF